MSLRSELKDIDGVGDATADKILEIVEPHIQSELTTHHITEALEYLEDNRTGQAKQHLFEALDSEEL